MAIRMTDTSVGDNLVGAELNDLILGRGGDDSLYGGFGADVQLGRGGDDTLGGAVTQGELDRFDGGQGVDLWYGVVATLDLPLDLALPFGPDGPLPYELAIGPNPALLYDTAAGILAFDSDGIGIVGPAVEFAQLLRAGQPADLTQDQIL